MLGDKLMGYANLTYEDYQSNLAYWVGSEGLELPLWAERISDYGYQSVCAIDFYDDIFGDDLEESRLPDDYVSGEYAAIALERIPVNGKTGYRGKRITVTKGNTELYKLIDSSKNFCMIAPVSYIGKQRSNKNARYLYALVIEIDNIKPKAGIDELFYSWERKVLTMPKPTYVVCSGSGVHLYFVFERPIPLFQNIFEQITEAKKHFTRFFWNRYVTKSYEPENVQYESINQPFRCVGTVTKNGKACVMAFETGKKITIEYLNEFLPEEKRINTIYKSKISLDQAKKLYPKWYQRRIIEGKGCECWNRHEGIYYNWIEKVKVGATVGHRYHCIENLCSLAVQCNISPEQVEKDCRDLIPVLDALSNEENNPFTEYDVLCALKTYHTADERAYRRKIEFTSKKTGIPLTPNKRNNREQEKHLQIARSAQNVDYPNGEWRNKNGRPNKAKIIQEWRELHPDGRKIDCERDTGLSRHTVLKWW